MNEKDTIFGSADALRRIILEVNKILILPIIHDPNFSNNINAASLML